DAAIGAWSAIRSLDEVLAALDEARVPSGRIYNARDIAEDPHYRARDMILEARLPDGQVIEVPGIVPKLSLTPGRVRSVAPALGADTEAVLKRAGVSEAALAELRAKGVL
ncbi:MAG TPA: CoA transferase, partial [Geothrix sp.]